MLRKIKNKYMSHGQMNWALLDQAMISGVNFITGLILARFLGIEEFGYFTLVWMVVLFLNSIQMALVSSPMMSIAPKQNKADLASYYGAVAIKQAYFSVISFLLIVPLGLGLDKLYPSYEISAMILPLAVAAIAVQAQDFIRRMFFTQDKAKLAFASDTIRYLGQVVLLLLIVTLFSIDTIDVLWLIAGASILSTMCSVPFIRNLVIDRYFPTEVIQRHWLSSKWMVLSALLQWLSSNFYFLLAGAFLGPAAVGALKAAQNLLAALHIVFQGLENIVPKNASARLYKNGYQAMSHYLRKVAMFSSGVTACFALIMGLSAEFWLALVFGDSYSGYGFVVQWWALIYVIMSILLPLRSAYRAMESTKSIFTSYVLAALFAVTVGWVLVQQFELVGVMVGLLLNYLIMAIYLSLSVVRVATLVKVR